MSERNSSSLANLGSRSGPHGKSPDHCQSELWCYSGGEGYRGTVHRRIRRGSQSYSGGRFVPTRLDAAPGAEKTTQNPAMPKEEWQRPGPTDLVRALPGVESAGAAIERAKAGDLSGALDEATALAYEPWRNISLRDVAVDA
jgi:hypothetical protein